MPGTELAVTLSGAVVIATIAWFFWLKKAVGTRAALTSSGFGAFNKSARLPQGQSVAIELMPREPGEYPFTCQMGMYRGRLVVE